MSGQELIRLYAHGGDTAAALSMLERGVAARNRGLHYILIDSFLDPLRSEPRFRSILTKFFPADTIDAKDRRRWARA
jgi:hypothetical protein